MSCSLYISFVVFVCFSEFVVFEVFLKFSVVIRKGVVKSDFGQLDKVGNGGIERASTARG